MKNAIRYLFIVVCMVVCLLPFAGMVVYPTNQTTENREMAVFPAVVLKNGKPNINFLQELGNYFGDHFAFRLELVSADAEIQSKVFQVSNADSVIVGTDGWLYYASTVDDYLGKNIMSERGIKNIAYNLLLVQQYVEGKGAKFIFTVPPNKNTLYGENMPYYLQKKISNSGNIDILAQEIKKYGISYCDLFSLFKSQDEVFYLKRDSHWNNKGAVLVYNTLLGELGIGHDNFEDVWALRRKEEYGDLGQMLYPLTAEPEWNNFYQKENVFSYVTDTKSVEDTWIETANHAGKGQLLMFRDSFGNTLLPLMADTFAKGYFSRGVPQNIAGYMELYHPDVVIFEKVERNLKEIAVDPPILEGAVVGLGEDAEMVKSDTSLNIQESENDSSYLEVSGILDRQFCSADVEIYIRIRDDREQTVYKAFHVADEKSDYGYKLYLSREKLSTKETIFEVVIKNGGKLQTVQSFAAVNAGKNEKPKIVSKEKVYDCDGSGHGYYLIKWSDGTEEYEDF